MSQEEIEALMNGLDIVDDGDSDEETVTVNTQEIEELLSQTEELKEDIKQKTEKRNLDEETIEVKPSTSSVSSSDIERLLSEIENANESSPKDLEEDFKSLEIEDLKKEELLIEPKRNRSEDEIVKDWTSSRINEGVFPLPAEQDTKVVNQLTQVANDSEEKVSQIFDVLSLTLDNNNELRTFIKDFETFINSQSALLGSLNSKFPNIKVFDEHLSNANKVSDSIKNLKSMIKMVNQFIYQILLQ
jgi:hypothetical protein